MFNKKHKAVFQLRVTLRDIEPPIWRSVQLPEDTRLSKLHRILQLLFNWEDYHLHDFIAAKNIYSVPDREDEDFDRKVIDENTVQLNRVVYRVGNSFEYLYDFGDNWLHDILLEAILLATPDVFYPRCVGGARNAPPEDAGGRFGYARYLEALADPEHREHEAMLAWRGEFDPEAFSIEEMNARLKRTFHRRPARNTGKKRIPRDTEIPLELTDQERELILKHSLTPEALTRQLRIVPHRGEPAIARYTLDELDELSGYVAAESSHAKNRKLHDQWHAISLKITEILNRYTDEDSPT